MKSGRRRFQVACKKETTEKSLTERAHLYMQVSSYFTDLLFQHDQNVEEAQLLHLERTPLQKPNRNRFNHEAKLDGHGKDLQDDLMSGK